MAGFGDGSFGYGPLGGYDWAKHVLYKDLPEIDRSIDRDEEESRLERFMDAIAPSFSYLREKAKNFGDLRDPDTVRTQRGEEIAVSVASAVANGRIIAVTLVDPDPLDPTVPIGMASVGWILEDALGREYQVNEVRKNINTVYVTGISDLPETGSAILRPPSLIEFLGADYGIEVDFHEPDAYQRSSVKNAVQWFDLKGSEKSYDIIGKISGYRVTPFGLWSINSPDMDGIPENNLFELPVGSGKFYTNIAPNRPMFDEIAADVIPVDYLCHEEPDWTSLDLVDGPPFPLPPVGTTLQEAIGWSMNATPVISTTDLGDGRWRIRVGPAADLSPIVGVGQWYALFSGMSSTIVYLETLPQEVVSGEWEFEVLAGTTPTFGSTVDLEYECRPAAECGFCRASVIRVEVEPAEVLTDPGALLDGVLTRMIRKILQVVPIHVRLTDIVHIIGPVQLEMNISVTGQTRRAVFAYGSMGYYFDIVPADELPLDPDHMVVTGTAITIP